MNQQRIKSFLKKRSMENSLTLSVNKEFKLFIKSLKEDDIDFVENKELFEKIFFHMNPKAQVFYELGSKKSESKAKSSRENGKKGGRPKGKRSSAGYLTHNRCTLSQ